MVTSLVNSEIGALLLVLLLIGAFVIAFKIMQMVFETIMVSALSAGFYLSLVYLFSYPFTVERVLLFALLGATLYMAYSFLVSMYSIVARVIEIPYHLLKALLVVPTAIGRKTYSYLKKEYKLYRMRKQGSSSGKGGKDDGDDDSSEDVRDVVLDKVGNEE